MTKCKLIVVEGVWGLGKTTTAQFIYDHLIESGVKVSLFLEGDLDHPADYDKVACFTVQEYNRILQKHSASIALIRSMTEDRGAYKFIPYGKCRREMGDVLPDELLADVMQHDIYDGILPLERYCEVHLTRWREFVQTQLQRDEITIFECCFIQNPLTAMLGRYDAPEEAIINYVLELANVIKPLFPQLIYFHPGDVRVTLNRAFEKRSSEWKEGVTQYFTKQGYGLSHGLTGFDGLVEFLVVRTHIERKVLRQLPLRKKVIDNNDLNWDRVRQEVIRCVDVYSGIDHYD
ncbi:hypothetical protein [Ferroacidibacillus organovorans]|uniref:Thymidylate kinase-like domain-containing protein n=1 Tax=Ferroacidibacillus organovorans TaxID=1765683 RepID=A0A853KDG9_9BACL|nr:hypothetical protein [Ferroacidibacillus organovorans]KYP82068.1 hypothetical protein AYJ22_05050 [Ferroacidibacillus organovorans]OAG94388.1 hypothetical protein AYW79_05870 [Ferroacidibacillus organovorans]